MFGNSHIVPIVSVVGMAPMTLGMAVSVIDISLDVIWKPE